MNSSISIFSYLYQTRPRKLLWMTISVESTIPVHALVRAKLESAASIFTVSREDIFDYKRCPKIVSIKTYRTTRTKKLRHEVTEPKLPIPNIVGQIGEAAVRLAFSGNDEGPLEQDNLVRKTPEKRIAQLIMSRLNLMDKRMQEDLELLAKKTIEGLREIRADIDRALGPLTIIGRGESRYGTLPTCGYPDYVALTSNERPVLIEVKNGAKESPGKDKFQASFYNSLGKTVGVVVHDMPVNDGGVKPNLQVRLEEDAETLILYPRLNKWRKVTDTVNIEQYDIEEIWGAKQLGIIGRWPAADCGSGCPHTIYGIVLPEDSLDIVARPLPLIFAKGAADLGADYDFNFMCRYISRTVPSAMNGLWNLSQHLPRVPLSALESFRTIMENRLGVGQDVSTKLLRWLGGTSEGEQGVRTRIDQMKIEKEMAAYLEPWKQLLPEKMLDAVAPVAQSIGTRTYTLPTQSNLFIERSWKRW